MCEAEDYIISHNVLNGNIIFSPLHFMSLSDVVIPFKSLGFVSWYDTTIKNMVKWFYFNTGCCNLEPRNHWWIEGWDTPDAPSLWTKMFSILCSFWQFGKNVIRAPLSTFGKSVCSGHWKTSEIHEGKNW